MKTVLAFDSFKGCMTAEDACHTAALAIHEVMPDAEIVECPLSDGGEGLVDCVEQMLPGVRIHVNVHDPLMNMTDASYVIVTTPSAEGDEGRTAYMEMAAASGLPLVPMDKRNPLLTTTYGVGDMIIDALNRGCKEIVMGIGGSATCDGGRGMIQCLKDNGYMNTKGEIVDQRLADTRCTVACDVTNPLYGKQGAAFIFAPQKGATPEQVKVLDEQLIAFAKETEKAGLATPELVNRPGAGAAGGLGYGLMAYLKAELKSGIDIVLNVRDFDNIIKDATLVITGEGKSDEQTLMGKVPHGVLRRASAYSIPVWLMSGAIDDATHALANSFDLVKSINEGDSRPLSILMQPSVAKRNLEEAVKNLLNEE